MEVQVVYDKILGRLRDGAPEDIIPEVSDMWGVGVSDTWLNFELINSQTLPIYNITSSSSWDSHTRTITLDASSNNVQVYLPYNSYYNVTTSLVPNIEYSVTRTDDTSDYYGYVMTSNTDYSLSLPVAVLKEKEDFYRFRIHQNKSDVTDLSFSSNSNRKVRNFNVGTLTSDGVIPGFSIPPGYNIFTVKATAGGGSEGLLGLGTTSDASDILNAQAITSDADLYFTWNKFNVNLTDSTQLYVKSIPDWSSLCSDISIEICCYQDNF